MKNMLVVLLGVTVGSLPFASHAGSGVDAVTVGVLNTPPVAAAAATNAPTDEDTNAIPMKVQM
ncbi:MAG TPA: hypothetical protein VN625_10760, partial [Desulfuromonadaceae bacterium]|nr:hypothetical protein [Desulfuromonadaceae bacterium]